MKTKLSTLAEVARLRTGDIVKRFPTQGEPQDTFDESRKKHTDTFEIRSINASNEMVELVMTGESVHMFSSAGDIGRVFIKSYNLIEEKVWWV
ncbi:MAG: hypothetical protein EOP56_15655 [Sphingobacteriales bacterium]|nr:MAG: hypothetical protein EOP56_15655 [Sphingobacteriales bacterium]